MAGDEGMSERGTEPESGDLVNEPISSSLMPVVGERTTFRVERWDVPLPFAIAFAGFAYPIVVTPLFAIAVLVSDGLPAPSELVAGCLYFLFGALAASCLFAFLSLPISTFVWGIVWIVRRSLGLSLDEWRVGADTGAWTSLVMSSFGLIILEAHLVGSGGLGTNALLLFVALGPGIATPLAQHAGAWSQWPRRWRNEPQTKRQFGISQVLALTAWVALALTLLKLLGLLDPATLIYLLGWIAYQWITKGLVMRLCEWRSRRVLKGGGGDGRG